MRGRIKSAIESASSQPCAAKSPLLSVSRSKKKLVPTVSPSSSTSATSTRRREKQVRRQATISEREIKHYINSDRTIIVT